MLITAIEPRRKSLRALYLDGELAVNIDAQTLLSSRFQVGTEITDEELLSDCSPGSLEKGAGG